MKTLFVHDHIFYKDENSVYSDKIPYSVLERYISIFSNITVMARVKNINNSHLPLSSGKNVNFIFMESIGSLKSYFGQRKKIEKKIEKILKDFDSVIVRLPSEYGNLVSKVAEKMNIPVAAEVVGCAWDAYWNYGSLQAKIYAPYAVYSMKKSVSTASHVLYVTEHFLQRRYPINKHVQTVSVSNVELTDLTPLSLEKRLKKIEEYTNKNILRLGTIGSFKTKYKGIHLTFSMLNKLKNYYDFEYHILGDGDIEYYMRLAKEYDIENNVFFDGLLASGKPVYNWIDNLDIYLQPSLQEGLPRATIEALSRGCPAIVSSAGGLPELISKDLICNPKNPNDFLKKTLLLIEDKDRLHSESKKNFNTSKKYEKNILDEKRSDFWNHFKKKWENKNEK